MNNISSYQKPSIEIPNSVIDIVNFFFSGHKQWVIGRETCRRELAATDRSTSKMRSVTTMPRVCCCCDKSLVFCKNSFFFSFSSLDLSQNRREDERDFFFMAYFEDSYWQSKYTWLMNEKKKKLSIWGFTILSGISFPCFLI